ncbi:formate--tetrahydrofolate ligase [Sediminivirga luteola]|uniref:Formate--tetrahydrofolate ligase n=1 Tax=Sediminivirga luteola TaxID=1774748 RepID=A0A8J2XKI3_9MICO|nr:formate--tetrahydrofolate ligase [Sediminivirga luteola]MCI2265774.1 formate--tetrahydrofolate ligase [Sediminivirga luteola]GGA14709.1 formate--tetrahydrofolate ligase [Sediminivirga luteola]
MTSKGAQQSSSSLSVDQRIAAAVTPAPITDIGARLGLEPQDLIPYGHDKAKVAYPALAAARKRFDAGDRGRLVLVTAMSPTPAGEGKTTTTVGLADAFAGLSRNRDSRIPGARVSIALREPSLGPVFGMKGGAAGGGHAQVVPMEDINLHFTGDFSAIGLANNLLAAMLDNSLHQGNPLRIDPRRIRLSRAIDMNDRVLRQTVAGLGGPGNGQPREDGWQIVVASEVMAIFCLATSISELRERLGRIVVAEDYDRRPVTAADLGAAGAMTALLRDALQPNLVQSLEQTPAFVHGGPFANIAHGCNSAIATTTALALSDLVVTEAGFGADLGAEKFLDIKARAAGIWPDAAVLVATLRAIRHHGGLANVLRHAENLRDVFGLAPVVCLNRFPDDSDEEMRAVIAELGEAGVVAVEARHWAEGGSGATTLAEAVLDAMDGSAPAPRHAYDLDQGLAEKIEAVASRIYRAGRVEFSPAARRELDRLAEAGHDGLPVCMAKTQYSFSGDAALRGAPEGHVLEVRSVRLAAGAGFVVVQCGDIMTMPGLPKEPAALSIDVDEEGRITGLF